MRLLTEDELTELFKKLAKYIGPNTKHLLLDRSYAKSIKSAVSDVSNSDSHENLDLNESDDEENDESSHIMSLQRNLSSTRYVFRFHKSRIWYIRKDLVRLASCIAKKNLMCIGTLFAKVTHHGKIRIHITALEYIAQYSLFKIWIKPNQEQRFLYGNNVTRNGLGRITENVPKYHKVAVFSMSDIPLGFGVASLSTLECRRCEMNSTVLFHEADIGEYLRDEIRLT